VFLFFFQLTSPLQLLFKFGCQQDFSSQRYKKCFPKYF